MDGCCSKMRFRPFQQDKQHVVLNINCEIDQVVIPGYVKKCHPGNFNGLLCCFPCLSKAQTKLQAIFYTVAKLNTKYPFLSTNPPNYKYVF